jgi:molybdenum cofactor synthesis domain-containing protein
MKIKVITLSDRAFRGEYQDLSGPEIVKFLKEFNNGIEVETVIIPDNEKGLRLELKKAKTDEFTAVFTTGGTGIGPRDITPEVVIEMCDKLLPGIMELIRIKYGMEKPNALLSRSVAGLMDKTLVYALPGSVKAVREYMTEILKSFDHAVKMVNGEGH